jgi:TRAP-type uncharacterized transport system substrate-binding protein
MSRTLPPSTSQRLGRPSPRFWGKASSALAALASLAALVLTSVSSGAFAAPATSDESDVQTCSLKIASGPQGLGYSLLFKDVAEACREQVTACEVKTTGGLKNLTALSANETDLGFVQLDTLQTMATGDENIAKLQVVAPAGMNLLHIITSAKGYAAKSVVKGTSYAGGLYTSKDTVQATTVYLRKFSDLKTTKAPLAAVGSAQLLIRVIDNAVGYGLNVVPVEDTASALAGVKNGTYAAALVVGAWPLPAIKGLPQADFSLMAYDLSPSTPYSTVKKPYPNLGIYNLPFLGVQNVLVTRPYRPEGAKGKSVAALQTCLSQSLADMQEGSAQPTWKDVKSMDVPGWTMFRGLQSTSRKK